MRGLKIVVLTGDAERFRGALTVAAAHAAIGGDAAILLQLEAVGLLRRPVRAPGDAACAAIGLPTLGELIEEALELGVALVACQTGLMLAGLAASDLDPRVAVGGPVGFLQALSGDERLVLV
jgi:predicted peroxiredoxin